MTDTARLLKVEMVDAVDEMIALAIKRAVASTGLRREVFSSIAEGLEVSQKRRREELDNPGVAS